MRVLEELRRLEEAERRGDVDKTEAQKLRAEILALVEDAEVSEAGARPSQRQAADTPTAWQTGAFVCVGLIVFSALMAWLFDDLSMGITLGIAALAVVVIRAAQMLEERDDPSDPIDLDDSLPE